MTFPTKMDILHAMTNPAISYKSIELIGGEIFKRGNWVNRFTGGFTIVFPFLDKNGNKIAVRCWHDDIGEAKKRTTTVSSHLEKLSSNYFVRFRYIESAILIGGIFQPVVIMDWKEEPTLKEYIKNNLYDRNAILKIAENFQIMVKYFHEKNIAHGDLAHGNIKVKDDGSLMVLDYDSMYVEGLDNMADVIKGQAGYQHPARPANKHINPKLDYFSELVIYLSLIVYADEPTLYNHDTDWLLFSKEDLENPHFSDVFNQLLKSTNPKIKKLTEILIDCLKHDDICKLKPLEKILSDDLDLLAQDISDKF